MRQPFFQSSLLCLSFLLLGCSGASPLIIQSKAPNNAANEAPANIEASAAGLFDPTAIVGTPKIVDCTLSGGAKTECLSITLSAAPTSFEIGPWCPRHIDDGPDVSGIWLNDGRVYDADGAFIQNLPAFYGDDAWKLFDPKTGKINVTDSKTSCAAAARPDVAPEYQNHCVECQVSYLEEGLTQTYVIPLNPIAAENIAPRIDHAGVGIAFSGVRLDAPAPLDAILSAHTLAAFDDCGGHVNLHVGYHIHAVTGCLSETSVQKDHAAKIGLAMDGYSIHTRVNPDGIEPENLDACRGHETAGLGYHYHANVPGENAILTCHTGQTGCALESPDQTCDASAQQGRRPPPGGRPPEGRPPRLQQ